jgi:hypothetical protein
MDEMPTNEAAPYRHCGVSMCAGACLECNVANRVERRIVEWLRDMDQREVLLPRETADAIERGEHRG